VVAEPAAACAATTQLVLHQHSQHAAFDCPCMACMFLCCSHTDKHELHATASSSPACSVHRHLDILSGCDMYATCWCHHGSRLRVRYGSALLLMTHLGES
jgi:hypothetical protein